MLDTRIEELMAELGLVESDEESAELDAADDETDPLGRSVVVEGAPDAVEDKVPDGTLVAVPGSVVELAGTIAVVDGGSSSRPTASPTPSTT